ncbi:MAG: hypothetical protein ABJD97_05675 [Betaproteobacteria bacterium]
MLDHTAESWAAATLASIKSPDVAGDSPRALRPTVDALPAPSAKYKFGECATA